MASSYSVSSMQATKPLRIGSAGSGSVASAWQRRAAVWVSAGVVVAGAAWYMYRRRVASLEEDDDLFQQAAVHSATAVTAGATTAVACATNADDVRSRGLTVVESNVFVPDETRLEAIESLKLVIPRVGGKRKDDAIKNKDAEDDASSDDSYETDMDLEFSIANEMEKILRKQIISHSAAIAPLGDAAAVVDGTQRGGKKGGRQKKTSANPTLSLLESAKEYLEVSHERLKLKRKIAQRDFELALSRPFGGANKNRQSATVARQVAQLGGRYGDYYDDDEEDDGGANDYWGGEDDDDEGPMMWGGDDEEQEEWEDDDDEGLWEYNEEDEEEEDGEEEAWLQALSGGSETLEPYDEMERAEFERELIKRVVLLAAAHQPTATASTSAATDNEPSTNGPLDEDDVIEDDDAWESESEDDDGSRRPAKKRDQRRRGMRGNNKHSRHRQGDWVDM